MLNRFKEQDEKDQSGLTEEQKADEKEDVAALEKILEEQQEKSEITPMYKLFNLICKENPDQVLRYF
jgi:hypothetical protein